MPQPTEEKGKLGHYLRPELLRVYCHFHATVICTYELNVPRLWQGSPIHGLVLDSAKNELAKPSLLRSDIVIDPSGLLYEAFRDVRRAGEAIGGCIERI